LDYLLKTANFLRTFTYIAAMVESASAKITEGNRGLWISGMAMGVAGAIPGVWKEGWRMAGQGAFGALRLRRAGEA
jgi:hypothetical protein